MHAVETALSVDPSSKLRVWRILLRNIRMSMLLFELSQLLQALVEIFPGLGTDYHRSDDMVNLLLVVVVDCGMIHYIFLLHSHFSVVVVMMMSQMMMMMAVVMMRLNRRGGSMCFGHGVGVVLLAGKDGGHRHSRLGGILVHIFLSAGCIHGSRRGGG